MTDRNIFNHSKSSQAHEIDRLLLKAAVTMKTIVKSLVKKELSERETLVIEKRVITHINHLKREHSDKIASLEKCKETKQYILKLRSSSTEVTAAEHKAIEAQQ